MAERRARARRRHRARVFVDFWNYTLLMRAIEAGFRTDWSQLGPVLAEAAVGRIDDGAGADYQGLSLMAPMTRGASRTGVCTGWQRGWWRGFRGWGCRSSRDRRSARPRSAPALP